MSCNTDQKKAFHGHVVPEKKGHFLTYFESVLLIAVFSALVNEVIGIGGYLATLDLICW